MAKLTRRRRAYLHRYSLRDGLLYYQVDRVDEPRIVVHHDEDLRYRIIFLAHDIMSSRNLGCEKMFKSVGRDYWWHHLYK